MSERFRSAPPLALSLPVAVAALAAAVVLPLLAGLGYLDARGSASD